MLIRALFFAHLKDMAGASELEFDLPDSTTISQLAERLSLSDVRFNGMLRYARPAVNGEWATAATVLCEGDEVGFLPPSSGG
jgi:molybdopterin synthase catalytic subunit